MKRKAEKTTVLFLNKNQTGFKPVQVSNGIIQNWKKYIAAIFILFIGLVGVIGYLMSDISQQNLKQTTLNNKLKKMRVSFARIDTNAVREKFTNIDKELSTINKFLKARGIKEVVNEPQGGGGEDGNEMLSAIEIGEFYEGYLKKINYNLSYTPIGLPYSGRITSRFGHRENPFTGMSVETHKGLDIKGPYGAHVKSMAKGKVTYAGRRGGYGNCIVLRHGNGFETLYGHLSKILVKVGEKVDIGQHIGNIGSTGRSTGPHLHYEVHKNGQRINPESFLTLK